MRIRKICVCMAALVGFYCFADIEKVEVVIQSLNDYNGIDVSKYQGNVDWKTISRNKKVEFVYLKATEGATYVSPVYHRNFEQAKRLKISVGSYHFYRTSSGAYEQFDNFKSHVPVGEQTLLPLIDIEKIGSYSSSRLVDSLKVFLKLVEKHYHVKPMLYTYAKFYNKHLAGEFKSYPLFIAKYHDEEPELIDNAKVTLWQFSDQGKMLGINGKVDLNKYVNGASLNDILVNKKLALTGSYAYIRHLADPSKISLQSPTEFADRNSTRIANVQKTVTKEQKRLQKEEEKNRKQLEKERKELEKQRKKELKELEKQEKKRMKELQKVAATDPDAAQELQELMQKQAERKAAPKPAPSALQKENETVHTDNFMMPTRSRKR